MRWLRLFLLGVVSVYPLYWTAQFVLFFLPATLRSFAFRLSLTVVDISYLQATAIAGKSENLPPGLESLIVACVFSLAIWYLRGDQFLTGGLAIVVLGQSALLPFLNQLLFVDRHEWLGVSGVLAAMCLICFGLHRILGRVGGTDFLDRFALLNLLAILPQAALWFSFRLRYPFFGTKFLLMLLLPIYLGSMIVSVVAGNFRPDLSYTMRAPVPRVEIFANFVAACLLFTAIGLTTHTADHRRTVVACDLPRILSA